MTVTSPLFSSRPPSGAHMYDFDLVTLDGRLLLVGSPDRDRLACTWDPAADRWTTYELDAPDEDYAFTELTSLCAAVVDGRLVIGGGGEHQGFAMWDLATGRVRLSAQEGGTASSVRADFGDHSRFVVGDTSFMNVDLWDPSLAEPDEDGMDGGDDEADVNRPELISPYDSLTSVRLECQSRTSSAAAAGLLDGSPVVVAGGPEGNVLVWDVDEERPLAEFDGLEDHDGRHGTSHSPGAMLTDFALVTLDGRTQVVAAGRQSVRVGDPRSGKWGEPLTVPGGEIVCLDAGTVQGAPVAVTGAEDGTVCVWDLAGRRLLGRPFRKYDLDVFGVRLAELGGRAVLVSSGKCSSVDVWEVPS